MKPQHLFFRSLAQISATFVCGILLSGCEKEIDMEVGNAASRPVVEAVVTQGAGPHRVRISRSVGFTSPSDFPWVENASVTLADDQGNTEQLAYIGDGVYATAGTIIGTPGRRYALTAVVDGATITGSSTMAPLVALDTVRVDSVSQFGSYLKILVPIFTDPLGEGDRYRMLVNTNGVPWSGVFTYDDRFSDGLINEQPLFPNDDDQELESGDVVTVDLLRIDPAVYDYFFSLQQILSQGPDGSAAPADPVTNLSGGALGYFSAHTVSSVVTSVP